MVEEDFVTIEEKYNEYNIKSMSKHKMKKFVKSKIEKAAFKYLLSEQEGKSKVKDIKYNQFKLQKYLTSNLFSNYEVEILNKLRSRNINLKSNFKTKFTKDNIMNLQCSFDNCLLQKIKNTFSNVFH